MSFDWLKNGCEDGYLRYKWASLGRTGASQSSHAIDERGRAFGWGQNNDFEAGVGDYIDEGDQLEYIELATKIGVPGRCIKICSGEYGSLAINHKGEVYGWGTTQGGALDNCASFALPHNSGSHGGDMFATPTRAAPGYLFKDISFDFYHAACIGMDDKLYTWGYDDGDGSLGLGAGITSINTPTLNPTLTADIKLVDSELLNSVAVTVDDKVYLWGTWWGEWSSYVPIEVTGLVIPPGETIVSISCSYLSVIVLLSNGELWGAGDQYIYGDQGATASSSTFKQITCFTNPIVLAKTTALGSSALWVIDNQGDIYGWSDGIDEFVGNDPSPSPDWWLPNLIASEYPGQHKWVDVVLNTHNSVFQAIDEDGWLWTWGGQWWGPHLATNTVGYASQLALDPNVEGVVYLQPIASLASSAVDTYGDPVYLNNLRPYSSEYFQPLPQTLRHKPCGHWHLREFFKEEIYPKNCWMPSLAIKDNILLFAATGRWAKDLPGSGNEVLMFTYDIDANLWDFVVYEEGYAAANAPGGADIDTDVYVYANWKADQVGSVFNEVYTNYGVGVWVYNVNTKVTNYTYFADSKNGMYMANKVVAYTGGVVAIVYEDTAGQLLVRVSTDYGVTWNLRKTVGVLAARKDFSIVMDKATGYIYLAHQIDSSHVMVEQTIDNGLNWTTRIASNYLIANMIQVRITSDGTKLFLFGSSDTALAIETSGNYGTSWGTITNEPGSGIIASGANVADGHSSQQLVVAAGPMYNYIYDEAASAYRWLERDTSGLSVGGGDSSLASYSSRFAYSNFNFHKSPDPFIIVLISKDMGTTWDVRATPLNHYEYGEFPDFKGCPLFCLTDVPHLNHIWKFEKSNWATEFVKQKDKYVPVINCGCPSE